MDGDSHLYPGLRDMGRSVQAVLTTPVLSESETSLVAQGVDALQTPEDRVLQTDSEREGPDP